MVRGYVYNADICMGLCCWQEFRNSRLVGGILAVVASLDPARLDCCCSVN